LTSRRLCGRYCVYLLYWYKRTHADYLLYWYKRTHADAAVQEGVGAMSSRLLLAEFACFTGTHVRILTQLCAHCPQGGCARDVLAFIARSVLRAEGEPKRGGPQPPLQRLEGKRSVAVLSFGTLYPAATASAGGAAGQQTDGEV
jgi:hypothetical protein